MSNNYFSSNLKYIRESKKMSKTELAKKLNVHQSTISRWENNEMGATIDNAIDVSEALNIPLPELLGIDLRSQKTITTTTFKKDGMEIKLGTNGKVTDDDLDEAMAFILNQKQEQKKLKNLDDNSKN